MSKLTAMLGMPRSGKSTFSDQWQQMPDPDGLHRVVVSGDNVRLGMHGMRYVYIAEPLVHGVYQTMIRTLLLNKRLHILMDDTHTSIQSIRTALTINSDAEFICVLTSPEICIERAFKTNQGDLEPVIQRMWQNLNTLIRSKHPDIAVRRDGIKVEKEYITEENIKASIEAIRKEVKVMLEYVERSV